MIKKNKKILMNVVIGSMLMFGTHMTTVDAYTGIKLTAEDKGVVYGRSMEWGSFDLISRVTIIPKGKAFTGTTPEGSTGYKWKAKYGVVGLDMLEKETLADGMNEKGLTAGLFYHPGTASYAKFDPAKSDITISAIDIVHFILTQFATVDEVREGMKKVTVVPVIEAALGISVAAHFMVTDKHDKSIVIEFFEGKTKIYDNPLGVITNAPTYDWHMTNLRNYVNLSSVAIPSQKINDLDFAPLGAGSGMIGLPGDSTPPSRFVRAVASTQTARPTKTTDETIYEVFRILDNFNLALGSAEGSDGGHGSTKGMRSSTIWTTGWDTKNLIFYYHTQHNRRVRKVDLKAIDFSTMGDEVVHIPLDEKKEQDVKDITSINLGSDI